MTTKTIKLGGQILGAPRATVAEVAELLRVTPRTVQMMAAKGDLPTAAQIGKKWTFNAGAIRRLVAAKEREQCASATCTKGAASGGCEPPLTASNAERAYERTMSRMLGRPLRKRRKWSEARRMALGAKK